MKTFRFTSHLIVGLTFFMFLPVLQAQSKENADIPWGAKVSGLQVRIRECPKSERKEGKALMIFEVRNTSDQPVDFCWWQSPLERTWTANQFKITGTQEKIDYFGMMVKRNPPNKKNGDYTTLNPGWMLSVTFDLKEVYGLRTGSNYSVRYAGTSLGLPPSNSIDIEFE